MVFYLNGNLEGAALMQGETSNHWATEVNISNSKLSIGTAYYSAKTNYMFNGYVDELSIFDVELSTLEVREVYNNGIPKDMFSHSRQADLVAWWRLGGADETNMENVNSNFQSQVNNFIVTPRNFQLDESQEDSAGYQ